MKVCRRCGQRKDLSEFYAGKRYKDGLQPWCKSCYRVYKIESGYSKNLARSYAHQHNDEYYREAYADPKPKRCPECKQYKSIAGFYRKVHSADGFASYCKVCDTRKTGQSRIKKRYGLTPTEYDRLFSDQNGKCAICGETPMTKKGSVVDHCHETGRVRGILCQRCNTAIGMLYDDPLLLRKAATYLTQ